MPAAPGKPVRGRGRPEGKQSLRHDLVVEEIMDKAAELFADRGFHGTGIRDIAESMEMSRPAVYHYFASKQVLLEALITAITGSITDFLRDLRTDPNLTPVEKIEAVVTGLVDRVAERPTYMRLLAAREGSLPQGLTTAHSKLRREALDDLEAILAEGIEAGELRLFDPRITALAIFGMCNWLAWWHRPDSGISRREIGTTMSALALGGLMRPESRRGASDLSEVVLMLREDLGFLERALEASELMPGARTKPA